MTVGGAALNTDSNVLVWAEINDVDRKAGNIEGFYCMATYKKDKKSSVVNSTKTF